MPVIVNTTGSAPIEEGDGWRILLLADLQTFGAPAMTARRWLLEPGATTPPRTQGPAEQLMYVIRGQGTAVVDGQTFRLADESVLWLEAGEQYHFVAGEEGLDILQGYAPG